MRAAPSYCMAGSAQASDGSKAPSVTIRERMAFANGWLTTPVNVKTTSEGKFRAYGWPATVGLSLPGVPIETATRFRA